MCPRASDNFISPSSFSPSHRFISALAAGLFLLAILGCESHYIPVFLGGSRASAPGDGLAFPARAAFTENLIQARTFVSGTAVTTVTYLLDDLGDADLVPAQDVLQRRRLGIDFNGDGRIDPVVGYGRKQAVIQILLSDPAAPPGTVRFTSLTLDSKQDMEDLVDVAVGDIDRDGALDIVASAKQAVWYFHHPTGQPTTALHLWGNPDQDDPLRERIDASFVTLTDAELQAIIRQAVGPGVRVEDYVITVSQLYRDVEIGDLDNDGDNDIAASRSFIIKLTPHPGLPLEPLEIVDGDVFVFVNPGFATTGHHWSTVSVGRHERHRRLDRDGAAGLLLYDLDGDGDLDVISAAAKDNNVQIAWFENPVQNRVGAPGPGLRLDQAWTQWRVGSVRDAWGLEVADVTGDGRPDVLAAGGEQMQIVLFEQPASGPRRAWDWDTFVLAEFRSYQPRDLLAVDIDNDGVLELVGGGNEGAVRYFERPADPRAPWRPVMVLDYDPPGEVGRLGYGDLDGDGDLDLVAVVSNEQQLNFNRITWIRNETVPAPALTAP